MGTVSVILYEDLRNFGKDGDVVVVRRGYGRYLCATGIAVYATKENLEGNTRRFDEIARTLSAKLEIANQQKEKLDALDVLVLSGRAMEDGRLFGSVTQKDIVNKLNEDHGIQVLEKNVVISGNSIKSLGEKVVKIFFHPDVSSELLINVLEEI